MVKSKRELAELLNERACNHNHKDKVGCARPQPGATAGGCAFDGAQIALLPIADVAHIVHGPIGCAGSSWDNRGTRSSGPELYKIGMTTDLTEQDVIMGRGERRLLHSIKQAINDYHPAAVFVYNTCVPALTGDNVGAVCKTAEQQFGVPCVLVDSAGFYGTKNLGNRIAGESVFCQVMGTRTPDPVPRRSARLNVQVHDVNLIGEYNIAGEFWRVAPLFDELGLRILCSLSGDARFREVQTMHAAEANMLVCSKALINVARKLEERYGTPWFEGSFYGVDDTSAALRAFADLIGHLDLANRTEALIEREEARIEEELEPYRKRLRGKKVLLYTGGVKSWSIVSALQDLGMKVVATGTKKSTEQDKQRIRELMGDDAKMIAAGSPRVLLDTFTEYGADMLIAGGRNMYTALKARVPFLDINQEREFPYAGYDGMVQLAQQITLSLESPVWEATRSDPPWASCDESRDGAGDCVEPDAAHPPLNCSQAL
jgi:nitrogenase molybdenum-cofactor synthesis protein NifE